LNDFDEETKFCFHFFEKGLIEQAVWVNKE